MNLFYLLLFCFIIFAASFWLLNFYYQTSNLFYRYLSDFLRNQHNQSVFFLSIKWRFHFIKARNDKFFSYNFQTFLYRSSHRRCFVRKGVLRNVAKFTGKHLYQSLYLNKIADLRSATLLKKRLQHSCFPVNFATASVFRGAGFAHYIRMFSRVFFPFVKSGNKSHWHFAGPQYYQEIFFIQCDFYPSLFQLRFASILYSQQVYFPAASLYSQRVCSI